MDNGREIAQTTWNQIPTMTKMACGARERMFDAKGTLTFKVGGKPMRFVCIELDPSDTYNVEHYRLKRGSYDKVSLESASGVYADALGEIVYHMVNK